MTGSDDAPSSRGFLSELTRRRVYRVAIVYVVVAWGSIEAADTIFPNLGLPGWTTTLVIALAALGFPVTLALAWIFDVTPAGIRRTSPHGGDSSIASSGANRRVTSALYSALAAIIVLVGGWLVWSRADADGVEMVESRIAIMPFRVSGAGADLAHLREGLPDLVAAALSADTVPSVVPTRAVLAALERRGKRDSDLLEEDVGEVADELGSGALLMGEIVATGVQVNVAATLVRAGGPPVPLQVSAPTDSLHLLVDRLTNQVVAVMGGTPQHRLAAVTSHSREAIDEYLHGAAAFRRGRYDEATSRFDRAVDLDSTFAVAAFSLLQSTAWSSQPSRNEARAAHLTTAYKRHLSIPDRVHLEARFGPGHPEVATPRTELLALRERAVRLHPQRAELWYELGDGYFHEGGLVGRESYMVRAADAFERAIQIDSTYLQPLDHAASVAIVRDDTAGFRRYSDLVLAIDSTSPRVLAHRWNRDIILGHSAAGAAASLLERFGADIVDDLFFIAIFNRAGLVQLADALHDAERRFSGSDRSTVLSFARALAFLEGKPDPITRIRTDPEFFPAAADRNALAEAIWIFRDSAAAERAARRLEGRISQGEIAPNLDNCLLGVWYARSGRLSDARTLAESFVADTTVSALENSSRTFCRQMLETLITNAVDDDAAVTALAALDRAVRDMRVPVVLIEVGNFEVARMWEAAGQPVRALAAQRRRSIDIIVTLPERLAEEGRLAELVGDREGAIRAYSEYLAYRTRPQGVFVERTEAVRARLAALTHEP